MRRWSRRRAAGRDKAEERPGAADSAPEGSRDRDTVHIEEIDGIHVVRIPGEPSPDPMSVAELGYTMAAQEGTTHTVLAGTEGEQVWAGLVEVLDRLRPDSGSEVLLVMSHAATGRGDRPAAARRIAERWGVRVTAPDGVALLVPGGSLFVPRDARPVPGAAHGVGGAADGPSATGWRRFTPGAEPEPLGRQLPEPPWQTEVDRLCAAPAGGTVAHRIPAGLLLRPKDMPAPRPDDLAFAVPVSRSRVVVLVGAPDDETEVPPQDVVDLLAPLSPEVRSTLLLAPGRDTDPLPAGQLAADAFGSEVEVLTGAPVMTDDLVPGGDGHQARTVLIGADGAPTWRPFVEAVACRPAVDGRAEPPRLLRWRPPVPGLGTERPGAVRLSDQWLVTAVRSGLRIARAAGSPGALPERPVDAEEPTIELGLPGEPLGGSVLPLLDKLLTAVGPETRERAALYVYGECGAEQMRELSRMMAAHGIRRLRTRPPAPVRRRPGPPSSGAARTAGPAPAAGPFSRPGPGTSGTAPTLPTAPAPGAPPSRGPRPAQGAARPAPVPVTAPGAATPAGRAAAPRASAGRTVPPADPAGEGTPSPPGPPPAPVPARIPVPAPGAAAPLRPPPPPLRPDHRASDAERAAFRALVRATVQEGDDAAVRRVLETLPVPGPEVPAADRTDLLAVLLYLTSHQGSLDERHLGAALRDGDPGLLPYAACLASGLARLPRFRGAVLRAGDPLTPAETAAGLTLRAPGPLSTLPVGSAGRVAAARYAIWSEYGRQVGPLVPGRAGRAAPRDEVVFGPGSAFRVLGVHRVRETDLVLLREVPVGMRPAEGLDNRDRAVLPALTDALAPLTDLPEEAPAGSRDPDGRWPARCTGPVGWR